MGQKTGYFGGVLCMQRKSVCQIADRASCVVPGVPRCAKIHAICLGQSVTNGPMAIYGSCVSRAAMATDGRESGTM